MEGGTASEGPRGAWTRMSFSWRGPWSHPWSMGRRPHGPLYSTGLCHPEELPDHPFILPPLSPHSLIETSPSPLIGFQHISERGEWDIQPGGKYFFTRNFRCGARTLCCTSSTPDSLHYRCSLRHASPTLRSRPSLHITPTPLLPSAPLLPSLSARSTSLATDFL